MLVRPYNPPSDTGGVIAVRVLAVGTTGYVANDS